MRQQLRQAVRAGRLPHAALIAGGSQTQARRAALLLAAAHNCEAPESWRPCAEFEAAGGQAAYCLPCRKTMAGVHPDVTVLDCAGAAVKVGQVRQLAASMPVLPNEGRVKPYILYDAQLLSPVCQNALLAALEEPPPAAAFILTCDHPGALLPTVRSRLTRWDADAADAADMADSESGAPEPDDDAQTAASRAGAVLAALDKNDEQSLLLAALACDTLNREQAALLLDAVRAGLLARAKDQAQRQAQAQAQAARGLLDAAGRLGGLRETLSRNAGVGHVCGAMAAMLAERTAIF